MASKLSGAVLRTPKGFKQVHRDVFLTMHLY